MLTANKLCYQVLLDVDLPYGHLLYVSGEFASPAAFIGRVQADHVRSRRRAV